MYKVDILKKAVEKAVTNGFDINEDILQWEQLSVGTNYYAIIFRKDFAKAIWGDELLRPRSKPQAECYKFRLQEMVTASEPLEFLDKYLSKN